MKPSWVKTGKWHFKQSDLCCPNAKLHTGPICPPSRQATPGPICSLSLCLSTSAHMFEHICVQCVWGYVWTCAASRPGCSSLCKAEVTAGVRRGSGSLQVKRVCFDILRRERHGRGWGGVGLWRWLYDVCPVDSFAQGNILSHCMWGSHLAGLLCACVACWHTVAEPLLVFQCLEYLQCRINAM